MNKVESALKSVLCKYPDLPLVIAYSGGVDSQVLLHSIALLSQRNIISNPITVCHVNHGLSTNALDWQAFAQQSCLALNLPLEVRQVNVQPQAQLSLEAQARDARYDALCAINSSASLIITGHHSDDQTETFILALKRGSGIKGLSAMSNEMKLGKDLLLRPFLTISREEIVNYANHNNLAWIEDESNADNRFDRNFIRNDIMPLLVSRWPSISNTINRSSEHCRDGQLLLDELAAEDLVSCQRDDNSLDILNIKSLSQNRFNNFIRYYLAQQSCLMPSMEQLEQLRLQLNAGEDKSPAVKVGDHYLRRYRKGLYLTKNFSDVSNIAQDVILLDEENIIELPDNLGKVILCTTNQENVEEQWQSIVLPSNNQKISIRFSHSNPTCLPDYRNHSRSVKKILQELNVPPWQRKRIPYLYFGDILVAALGYFVCQDFVAKENKPKLSVKWLAEVSSGIK